MLNRHLSNRHQMQAGIAHERSRALNRLKRALAPHPEALDTVGLCATCGGKAETFRDTLSAKEYTISRMCQKCQDGIFGDE